MDAGEVRIPANDALHTREHEIGLLTGDVGVAIVIRRRGDATRGNGEWLVRVDGAIQAAGEGATPNTTCHQRWESCPGNCEGDNAETQHQCTQ